MCIRDRQNYDSLCKINGVKASWCLLLLAPPSGNPAVLDVVNSVAAAKGELCAQAELTSPLSLARVSVSQTRFIKSVLGVVPRSELDGCGAWDAAEPCLVLIDARHKVVAPYKGNTLKFDAICQWVASVEGAIAAQNGGKDPSGSKLLWLAKKEWEAPGALAAPVDQSSEDSGEEVETSSITSLLAFGIMMVFLMNRMQ
eukprot:TRINITY_DN26689_c0_g1_i2.p1 TRINITY_DN26689_c0_g1~~TRINITY_DN26689_c0_g1_i2.p1  ORF type:complete len:199 (+),score=44.11 TRINITY_DN26689_c0_g1_i2:124-720(+)